MRTKQFLNTTVRPWAVLSVLLGCCAALTGCAHLTTRPFTFVQMCDPQIGFGGYEADLARFRQAVKQINARRPDFVVICGDLVNGARASSFRDLKAVKSGFGVPCYCAPGNHDVANHPTAATLNRYRKAMGRDYFAFDHKGCTFIILDTQLWKAPVAGESEKQEAWLKETLRRTNRAHRPVFIVQHYPLFEKTPDEPETYYNLPEPKRQELLQLFERSGVVAILAGHTHTTSRRSFQGIQMVTSETTSRNFDKRPFGFRVWHVAGKPPYDNEFVPLAGGQSR